MARPPSRTARGLASRLADLPTPVSPEATVVRDFTLSSFRTVIATFEMIVGNLAPALTAARDSY